MDNEKRFRSILGELVDYVPRQDPDTFIETRGRSVITAAQNLVRMIRETYSDVEADDLTKRLARAIINDDEEKFTRRVRQFREAKLSRKPRV